MVLRSFIKTIGSGVDFMPGEPVLLTLFEGEVIQAENVLA